MQNVRFQKLIEMLEEKPGDSFLLFALAKEYVKQNEPQKALDLYQQLIDTNPEYTGAYLHFGQLHEQLGDVANAESIYRQGIAVCENLNAHHDMNELRGALQLLTEEYDEVDE
jgi:tetratricopeptide (TPR) repeat protein